MATATDEEAAPNLDNISESEEAKLRLVMCIILLVVVTAVSLFVSCVTAH
jgi:hypothetical protein